MATSTRIYQHKDFPLPSSGGRDGVGGARSGQNSRQNPTHPTSRSEVGFRAALCTKATKLKNGPRSANFWWCDCECEQVSILAAYLEGPAITPVGTLTLRAGLAHVPIGPNFTNLQHSSHNIGRCEPAAGMLIACAACDKPILDKFLLNVLERAWHADCVRCFDCHAPLTDKCFSRESKLFCRADFFKRYGTKCGGCGQGISPSDLVRKAKDKVFHLNCFTCLVCRKQLSTGEELYVLDDNKFICKEDYINGHKAASIPHPQAVSRRKRLSVGNRPWTVVYNKTSLLLRETLHTEVKSTACTLFFSSQVYTFTTSF
ncbi:hypothetical protein GWI33_006169 [Rhynchophorus ferrugineus]|uniref:LIM zinc-binding domain-containing protein n=1 Tax=Rhynchophorus ferrugineus TaxID=354439 RepID=A0A834IW87_RHYFE|nr:hypothetical protein GWI33_006169 [Rhynchophorus ferrugineus]